MGVNITLSNLTQLSNQTSAISTINNNSATIVTGLSDAIAVAGDQMQGTLDMNSNRLINLTSPASMTEPLRVIDASMLNSSGTITVQGVPTGGSTGTVLTKTSNANFATAWESLPGFNNGTVNSLPYYSTASSLDTNSNLNINSGTLTIGVASSTQGALSLAGATSGAGTIRFPAVASGTIVFPSGSTNFGTTGGTSQVVMQTTSGGAFTVSQLSASSLTNGTTGTGSVVLASSPTFTGSNFIPLSQLVQEPNGNALLGNTQGSAANYGPFQIGQLATKAGPTGSDLLLISDQASGGALKQTTIGQAIAGQVSGVATVNVLTGALTLSDVGGGIVTSSASTILMAQPGGNLNKIINGTMDIWQRGTTINVNNTSAYCADRWFISSTSGQCAVTQQAGRSGGNTNFSMRITGSSGVSAVLIQQRIESYVAAPLSNAVCTFQAWLFNNTGSTMTPALSITIPTSQDVFASTSTVVSGVTTQSCTASAWTQISYTFSTSSPTTNGMNVILSPNLSTLGASSYISLTEVDVRETPGATIGLNSNPPPPEFRPLPAELALCQRYFTKNVPQGTIPSNSTANAWYPGVGVTTSKADIMKISFSVVMRTAPTITYYSPNLAGASSGTWQNIANGSNFASISTFSAEDNGFIATASAAGVAVSTIYMIGGGWSASAEL